MPLWTMTDSAAGAPKSNILSSGRAANGSQLYQNVQVGALVTGMGLGVFGVDTFEKANASFEGPKMTHSGWVSRKTGTGYVSEVAVTNGGTGYTPGPEFLTFSTVGSSGVFANASYQVNAGGSIANVTLNNPGNTYNIAVTANAVVAFTTPATLVVTMGGRVGRKEYITLVASGSMSRDANTDDAIVGG